MKKEEKNKEDQLPKIEVQLDPEIMKGVFTNVANIGYTKEEFILDYLFIQQRPAPFGKLVSRVIMTPGHAKRLLIALKENISNYEDFFGQIDAKFNPSVKIKKTLQ